MASSRRHGQFDHRLPLTTTFRPQVIVQTHEFLEGLKGLVMDNCDRLSSKYGYRDEQFTFHELVRRKRCVDCLAVVYSKAAKKRNRQATPAEANEIRRWETQHFDWWPEGKEKPVIVTGSGSLVRKIDEDGWENLERMKDGRAIDMNLAQYYEPGEYAKAMTKPRTEVKNTYGDGAHPLIPRFHETPLLGETMDPQKPCYTHSWEDRDIERMEWCSMMKPLYWSDYLRLTASVKVFKAKCIGHPGHVDGQTWTCCGKHVLNEGCQHSMSHRTTEGISDAYEKGWKLFETPALSNSRVAVALSCETAPTLHDGDPELVRVGLVDFFTGEVLINTVVFPTVEMLHLNTRWSGVSYPILHHARAMGTVLEGRDEARHKIWEYVGPETILIMHRGRNDLEALRWIHKYVIDTEELEHRREKSEQVPDFWKRGLQKLARAHLNRVIENSPRGHDTVENAMTLRDLVVWYLKNLPEVMRTKIDTWYAQTVTRLAGMSKEEAESLGYLDEARFVLARNYRAPGQEPESDHDDSIEPMTEYP